MQTDFSPRKKLAHDALLAGLAIFQFALASGVATGSPLKSGFHSVYHGIYIIYLGLLFLLSYFHASRSYILGALIWVCENFSRPRGRRMALFYFGLCIVTGAAAIVEALGKF